MKESKASAALFELSLGQLQTRLSGVSERLACGPDTEIVIEGYPRSGNTFTLDMIRVRQQAPRAMGHEMKIAHHTHRVETLLVGQALGKPLLVLLRWPEDAILSYVIYAGTGIEAAAQRYVDFYSAALRLDPPPVVVCFETVVSDINRVLAAVNAVTGDQVPLSEDIAADTARAYAREAERRAKMLDGQFAMRIAQPHPDREVLKQRRRAEVTDFLAEKPRIQALYEQVLRLAG